MGDQLIVDRGQDPGTQAAASAAGAVGANGWMAYVGGRSLFFAPWSASTISGLIAAGYGILPVYALATPLTVAQGSVDGAEAARLTGAVGIAPGAFVMLDVEPSFYTANSSGSLDYANAWQAAVQAAGFKSCMYSTAAFLDAFQSTPPSADAVIVARYPQPGVAWGPPSTGSIPDAQPSWPAARGWQYTNEVSLAGIACDLSVINFSLAGGLDMAQLDDIQATVNAINQRTALLFNGLFYGDSGAVDSSGTHYPTWTPGVLADISAKLTSLQTTIGNLQVPPANLQPVLDAIASVKAEVAALGKHLGEGTP